jgi:hypothetical protein
MPNRATIEAFAKAVESNDHVGAIERFYAADATTRENFAPPTVGKEALIAKERRALASCKSVQTTRLSPIRPCFTGASSSLGKTARCGRSKNSRCRPGAVRN